MRTVAMTTLACLLAVQTNASDELTFTVSDTQATATRTAVPIHVPIRANQLPDGDPNGPLEVIERKMPENTWGKPIIAQFVPGESNGEVWFFMPAGKGRSRHFRLKAATKPVGSALAVSVDAERQWLSLSEGALPVMQYCHGSVPEPKGTRKHFAPGENYARGDYISLLRGPDGEVLTEDYPADHPHHRAVWWSWPVTRWGDQVADIWAVVGVHARPLGKANVVVGDVLAQIDATSQWIWKSGEPIVREEVTLRLFRQQERHRIVDVEIRLLALEENVSIGGRPKKGYGGLALRAAPAKEQKIVLHTDPAESQPRRAWLDYSARFDGASGRSGVTIFEHPSVIGYPSELQQYAAINCVMPAFPGPREVAIRKDRPLVLRYRLWIHGETVERAMLIDQWNHFANPPTVTVTSN